MNHYQQDRAAINCAVVQLLKYYIEEERLLAQLVAQGWRELPAPGPLMRHFRAPILDDQGQEIIMGLPTHRSANTRTWAEQAATFVPILALIESHAELDVMLHLVASNVASVALQLLVLPLPSEKDSDICVCRRNPCECKEWSG